MTKLKIGTLAVIGVGLIGGSFAAALRRAGGVDRILGAGRRPETLARAVALGLIDEAVTFKEAAARADLIFIAAPVGAFEAIFSEIAPHLGVKTIVTDGGSTKRNVIEAARSGLGQRVAQFVPGHPMAGSHEKGPEAADPDLYVGRRVMLTPLVENHPEDVAMVQAVWQQCGANVVCIDSNQHDGVVAAVSHLPHWVAALFMEYITGGDDATLKLETAGSGFRDFTRVAQGSPEMWRDIFVANRDAMLAELASLRQVMDRAEHALREHDAAWLEEMLARAAQARADWPGNLK
ncbi:MAG: prephenate dehydrogenase/arogenate dehydrogenase family protein [Burkholderiales bacterium]|jgi:prephenate dehydrogenase|nr:prephenate dehydrogenase/arogenate dehydrogenase family protein [Burkholderiales bacterium]